MCCTTAIWHVNFFFFGVLRDFAPVTPPPQAWRRRRAEEDLHFFPTSPLFHRRHKMCRLMVTVVRRHAPAAAQSGFTHQSAKAEDGFLSCLKKSPDSPDGSQIAKTAPQSPTGCSQQLSRKSYHNMCCSEQMRGWRSFLDFPLLIWKHAQHSVWGGSRCCSHTLMASKIARWKRVTRKNGILISFQRKEKKKKTSEAMFRAQTNSPAVVSSSERQRWGGRWELDSESRWDTAAERSGGGGALQLLCFSAPKLLLSWPKINLFPAFGPLESPVKCHNGSHRSKFWSLIG